MIIEKFQYRSINGTIEGWRVAGEHSVPRASILFCRGGTGDIGAVNDRIIQHVLEPLAQSGFVVYATQYSGGPHSQGHDEYGGMDIDDVLALYKEIEKRESSDIAQRLGLLGFSRGAMSGCLALQKGLPARRAAFVSGVFDLVAFSHERPDVAEMWRSGTMFEVSQEALEVRSPVLFSEDLPHIPYLLLHTKEDSRVSSSHSIRLAALLEPYSTLKLFKGDDHVLVQHAKERNRLLNLWFLPLQNNDYVFTRS